MKGLSVNCFSQTEGHLPDREFEGSNVASFTTAHRDRCRRDRLPEA